MKTLFLDLASHSTNPSEGACIACVSEDKTEAIRFVDHRISDGNLLPLLEEVMKEAGWAPTDLTNIACVVGPGGFTSLRMAVTLANTYADVLKIPVAGVHQSDVYEARVSGKRLAISDEKQGQLTASFLWIHATKKQELFIRGFGDYQKLWPEPLLLTLTDLVERFPEGAGVAGEILPDQRLVLEPKQLKDVELAPLADVLPSFLAEQTYSQTVLQPWYGRGW